MSNFGSRIIKPLVIASFTFLSIKQIGFGNREALIVAFVPLSLGVLSVYTALGYAMAVGSLLLAVASTIYPPIKAEIGRLVPQISADPTTPPSSPTTQKN
jgi:hypothetical protein